MTALHDRLLAGFAQAFGGEPELVVRAPGRVNLIGEHTDYNDGFAMPVAIGQETRVAFRPGGTGLRVAALDFAEDDAFDSAAPQRAGGGWRDYVRGVVDELVRAGISVPPGQLAIAGSIAKGTGLSSSASLEVAVARVLLDAAGERMDPVSLALLAQRAECDFVGVRCGNLDQIASAATTRGHALLIDCRTLALRQIAMPADVAVMIVQSGVVRGLVDGEYNQRRQECERAARTLGVPALRDVDEGMLDEACGRLDDLAFLRARHVCGDNRRTREAARALASGDLVAMGALMRESHVSQGRDFGITVPHTDVLAALMNEAIGEDGGARQTGGGFGGAVVGLMRQDRVAAVREAVLAVYRTPAGDVPEICIEVPSDGAGPVG
ncbi:galactokinase [Novosphingobium aromaticivorans DSM 12444]|uniref:Galactokinase n=1 Tax=Novosphingobium aromaticivorans (strain ATCC 700278 / DSM 12444 / CCUG 56034 / CIP 105152 / NBRC 16084 / F199) TaxID=279238 RepID=Q2GAY2_NOVAD|nr:galactokinase [Novosphingobium aromaticivorans]ABD24991.1 galactokinase [Novosphingobium aromaticivorans DSM 12444]SCY86565.1 galactokinase [Novosphingobium aromaticivorans]